MDSTKHLVLSLLLTLFISIVGITGYMMIEGWNLLDSMYMTIITLTTVGYGEVHSVSRAGRIFTMMLVLFGVGFCLYVAGAMVQFMVEGRIRAIWGGRRLDNKENKNLKRRKTIKFEFIWRIEEKEIRAIRTEPKFIWFKLIEVFTKSLYKLRRNIEFFPEDYRISRRNRNF